MSRRKKVYPLLERVEITDVAAEGKAIGKVDEKVIFVPFVAPGDIVDIKITRKKKNFLEGKAVNFHKHSDEKIKPFCEHFGTCGGCKWQHLKYKDQLFYKQNQVEDNLKRIGKLELPEISNIIGSSKIVYYRNKLEFTFSNRKWLTEISKEIDFSEINMDALGFHIPGMFDRVLDIENCYLQSSVSNDIRNSVKSFAIENNYSFYDIRKNEGFLRNLIIRSTTTNDLMVILSIAQNDKTKIENLLKFISEKFPQITSLMYVINEKKNDTISDLKIELYKGNPYIFEEMENLKFKIGPKSFYQTNSEQAYNLYKIVRDFAGLKGNEIVYDLYTGTGTIVNFISKSAKKVIGIESIPEAIDDAKLNSEINNIKNTDFYAGDILDVMNDEFISLHGNPNIVITDPPRAGMHKKVVEQILKILPEKIVYVSCNPATQARDLELMKENYLIEKVQPVDMFPHTHHVENVVLLVRNISKN